MTPGTIESTRLGSRPGTRERSAALMAHSFSSSSQTSLKAIGRGFSAVVVGMSSATARAVPEVIATRSKPILRIAAVGALERAMELLGEAQPLIGRDRIGRRVLIEQAQDAELERGGVVRLARVADDELDRAAADVDDERACCRPG